MVWIVETIQTGRHGFLIQPTFSLHSREYGKGGSYGPPFLFAGTPSAAPRSAVGRVCAGWETSMRVSAFIIAVAALGLAACSEKTQSEASEAGDATAEALDEAGDAARAAAKDAVENTEEVAGKAARKADAAADAAKHTE